MSSYFERQPTGEDIRRCLAGYQVWIEVDLEAIGRNLDTVRRLTGAEVVPCVKKNAYAHGLPAVVAYLMTRGVDRFLVAKLWEARYIRRSGLDCGVINMDPLFTEDQFSEAVELSVTQVVYHRESARMLSAAAVQQGRTASTWVKVDTGLGRAGVVYTEAADLIEHVSKLKGVRVEGVFSTLLEDDKDVQQITRFRELREELERRGTYVETWSLASSHGVFFRPGSHFDAVRPGVMLFGFYPVPEARDAGAPRSVNVVVLGAFMALGDDVFTPKAVESAIRSTLHGRYLEENLRAFEAGRRALHGLT